MDGLGHSSFGVSNPITRSFSKELRRCRGEMSYAQFAAKVGISKSLAYKLETSGEGATLRTIYRLACALGCSVEELLGKEAVQRKRSRRG
jgi:transcriptional regulator with XRE-family HTH domain